MRRLAADDARLWRHAVRDVAPLSGRSLPSGRGHLIRSTRETPVLPPILPPVPPGRRLQPAPPSLPPLDHFAGVDRATAERLKRGRYPIEMRLDLHGMTQAEAHRALAAFVAGSRAGGRRCVLIITGHGRASGGVLKEAVPRWLGEPALRPHVLAITPAQLRDGGAGALYVLLRRGAAVGVRPTLL